jgi:hypothetical protein
MARQLNHQIKGNAVTPQQQTQKLLARYGGNKIRLAADLNVSLSKIYDLINGKTKKLHRNTQIAIDRLMQTTR